MTLANAFDRLRKMPFPKFAENDELSDWQTYLIELDGYVAGIATTVLSGGTSDFTVDTAHIHKLRRQLEAIHDIPTEDQGIFLECKHYLTALEEVAQCLVAGKDGAG